MEISNLDRGRTIAGAVAAVALVVSLFFLEWFSLSTGEERDIQQAWVCGTGDYSCTGWETFPILRYFLLAAAFAPAILGYILIRGHKLSYPPGEMTMIAGFATFVLIAYNGILFKPEPLLAEERILMRRHAVIGYEIVCDIPFLSDASLIVRHHHEHWDGAGYPDGLAGEEIPFAARIFSVVDALDAMTTNRPYSLKMSLAEARSEIAAKSGTQFDPQVVAELDGMPDGELELIKAAIA